MPGINHTSAKKVTRSHTTMISEARLIVKHAQAMGGITKISLGIIKPIGNGETRVKFRNESPTCLLATVRGRSSVQEIRFYLSEPAVAKRVVTQLSQLI